MKMKMGVIKVMYDASVESLMLCAVRAPSLSSNVVNMAPTSVFCFLTELNPPPPFFFFAIVAGRHPCPPPRLRVGCNSRAAPSDLIKTSSAAPGVSIYFLIKLQFRIDRTAGPTAELLGDAAVNAITPK